MEPAQIPVEPALAGKRVDPNGKKSVKFGDDSGIITCKALWFAPAFVDFQCPLCVTVDECYFKTSGEDPIATELPLD